MQRVYLHLSCRVLQKLSIFSPNVLENTKGIPTFELLQERTSNAKAKSKMNISEKKALLLETSKKMNSALAKKRYKSAYALLQIGNGIRKDLNLPALHLQNLENRFA